MPITGKWIFTAAMDVDPDKEGIFNEVYDQEHSSIMTIFPKTLTVQSAYD